MEILNRTTNGTVFKCDSCSKIHIEYNNLNFNFSPQEYSNFIDFFKNLNEDYWESANALSPYKRKIVVPVGPRNLTAVFNSREVKEIRVLLGIEKKRPERCASYLVSEIGVN
ncbi:DUF6686 family protein [Marinilabilia rubra]|nr:DUF6686 family protein [Marinilabilia rubra]